MRTSTYPKAVGDPVAGLRQRREQRGLPTGRIVPEPLEWWQVIENQTAREVSRLRREGKV